MGFPPKFGEGLVSKIYKLKSEFRCTNSTKNIKKIMKKNSHPRVRLFQSAGMSSRQKLRPQRMHQSLTQLQKLKNQRSLPFKKSPKKQQKRLRNKLFLTQKRLTKNQQQDWHL